MDFHSLHSDHNYGNMKQHGISLIIGGDGQLGESIKGYLLNVGEQFIETTRRKKSISSTRLFLDLSKNIEFWNPPDGVSVVYLCAAMTSIECCARDPIQSELINVHNTLEVAKKCIEKDIFVVFPSTNLVFDGTKPFQKIDDSVSPKTEYGRQKAETEKRLLTLNEKIAIVRFTKIISPRMILINNWMNFLRNKKEINPFSDMVMSPIPHFLAADLLYRVASKRLDGIFQLSGVSDITYEKIAYHIADRIGVERDLIRPIKALESNILIGHIPQYTTLDSTRVIELFNVKIPDSLSAINEVFKI